jgi:hypothetical protein
MLLCCLNMLVGIKWGAPDIFHHLVIFVGFNLRTVFTVRLQFFNNCRNFWIFY